MSVSLSAQVSPKTAEVMVFRRIGVAAYLLEKLLHDFWSVVDGEDNIFDTSSNERLNLVDNHGLVAKLDEGFRKGQGLYQTGRFG
jgi:hypothetical protein